MVWGYVVMFVYVISLCGIFVLVLGMWQYGIFDSSKSKEYYE